MLLVGGRGTLRFIAIVEVPFLAPAVDGARGTVVRVPALLATRFELPLKLCGGRGTYRPPGAGVREALLIAPREASFPRAIEPPVLRAAVL